MRETIRNMLPFLGTNIMNNYYEYSLIENISKTCHSIIVFNTTTKICIYPINSPLGHFCSSLTKSAPHWNQKEDSMDEMELISQYCNFAHLIDTFSFLQVHPQVTAWYRNTWFTFHDRLITHQVLELCRTLDIVVQAYCHHLDSPANLCFLDDNPLYCLKLISN